MTLFERLINPNIPITEEQSIIWHLSELLNTRRGSLPHLPDYGLPDLSPISLNSETATQSFIIEMQETLRRYEPRFNVITIKPTTVHLKPHRLNLLIIGETARGCFQALALFDAPHQAEITRYDQEKK